MAFTLNQLNAIEKAIASGSLKVSYDGKTVEYRSTSDLIATRNLIRSELIAEGALVSNSLTNRGPGVLTVFSRD